MNRPLRLILVNRSFFAMVVGFAVLVAAGLASATGPAQAAFAGDVGKIAFASDREGNWDIFVMNADGSGQTNITNSPASEIRPRWSPDGKKILFQRGSFELWTMNADGSGQTFVTSTRPVQMYRPAWTADGRQIVYEAGQLGVDEIYVVNVDGSSKTDITNDPADDNTPGTAARGKKVAFSSNRSGHYELYAMTLDGKALKQITDTPAPTDNFWPDWSPNGTEIVFNVAADAACAQNDIAIMHANGGKVMLLTETPSFIEHQPRWSPDGSRIVYFGGVWNGCNPTPLQVYVMNADGTGAAQLTTVGRNFWPDWQPLP